ncbi:MAG: hypothetical protein S4CHLAM37_14730 [Chlamydiia bacterium]|nr:hypothetical protein [Chlamydiia bacterium]
MTTSLLRTSNIRLPIMQKGKADQYRNPWNGKIVKEAGITPETHVISKCCHKALRLDHIRADHNTSCDGSIPASLHEDLSLLEKSSDRQEENAFSVTIITLDVENHGKRDIAVNPFTGEEILEDVKNIELSDYQIDDQSFEPVDPDFAGNFDNPVTKETYTKEFFKGAIITDQGHLFDKENLERYFLTKDHDECALCRRTIFVLEYVPPDTGLIKDKVCRNFTLGMLLLASGVAYIALLTLSSSTLGASLLLCSVAGTAYSAAASNYHKREGMTQDEKIKSVALGILTPVVLSYFGTAVLGYATITQVATAIAFVAMPCIYHTANTLAE